VYSTLVRYKVGPEIPPGTFIVETPSGRTLESPDYMTYVFHLRQGINGTTSGPSTGRELVAEDVKFTFDRFLTEQGNAARYMLESVDRVRVVDRYYGQVLLQEPFVWLVKRAGNPLSMWIIAPRWSRNTVT